MKKYLAPFLGLIFLAVGFYGCIESIFIMTTGVRAQATVASVANNFLDPSIIAFIGEDGQPHNVTSLRATQLVTLSPGDTISIYYVSSDISMLRLNSLPGLFGYEIFAIIVGLFLISLYFHFFKYKKESTLL